MNCGNFQNYSKLVLEGDASAHRFTLVKCLKDITYYKRMATEEQAATLLLDGVLQTLKLGMSMGFGERHMPEMSDIFLALNGDLERD